MNLPDLTSISPTIGNSFATFLQEQGVSPDGVEFKVMPPYVNGDLGKVVPVMAKVEGKWAGLSMAETASPSEYAALLDAIAA